MTEWVFHWWQSECFTDVRVSVSVRHHFVNKSVGWRLLSNLKRFPIFSWEPALWLTNSQGRVRRLRLPVPDWLSDISSKKLGDFEKKRMHAGARRWLKSFENNQFKTSRWFVWTWTIRKCACWVSTPYFLLFGQPYSNNISQHCSSSRIYRNTAVAVVIYHNTVVAHTSPIAGASVIMDSWCCV